MRTFSLVLIVTVVAVIPAQAVEFLGVELCKDSISTAVVLPLGSPLTLENVEVGAQGALVLLLRSEDKEILDQIDDLMSDVTGSRGVGDDKSLQWSGRQITAFAQVLKKKLAALAVNASDDCHEAGQTTAAIEMTPADSSVGIESPPQVEAEPPVESAAAVAAIPIVQEEPDLSAMDVEETVQEGGSQISDFLIEGSIQHAAFDDNWVDVMGVVVNTTEDSYNLAAFDFSLYDAAGRLICVDTISVAVLKRGQRRAFRDSILCPDYSSGAVDRAELQFAGGR